jgi:hypothetical protein
VRCLEDFSNSDLRRRRILAGMGIVKNEYASREETETNKLDGMGRKDRQIDWTVPLYANQSVHRCCRGDGMKSIWRVVGCAWLRRSWAGRGDAYAEVQDWSDQEIVSEMCSRWAI